MTLPPLLVVLHETVISAEQSTKFHGDPSYLGSYHAIVARNGDIIYLVPPEHKAFAAANSAFLDPTSGELEEVNGSVNDFAYHIALETPIDGRDPNKTTHSGYTREQYQSLAWLCVATGVQSNRITTHGEIKDPQTVEIDLIFHQLKV